MADGELTLTLDEALSERLRAAASEAGMSVEAYAREVLAAAAESEDPAHDWSEADRRLAEYDRTGEAVDAGPVLDRFVAEVEARAARRR